MEKYDPNQSVGFLIYEVSRLLRRDFNRRVAAEGLTQVQWRTIAYVAHCEGCNQVTLAESLEVKPITLTRLVDKLQDGGWIERRPDPKDRRAVRLHLTEKARPLLALMHEKALETRERALTDVDEAGRRALLDTLRHMKNNLNS